MASDATTPAFAFTEVDGVEGEVYWAAELPELAMSGLLFPTTKLRLDSGVQVVASEVVREFPARLTDAAISRLCELDLRDSAPEITAAVDRDNYEEEQDYEECVDTGSWAPRLPQERALKLEKLKKSLVSLSPVVSFAAWAVTGYAVLLWLALLLALFFAGVGIAYSFRMIREGQERKQEAMVEEQRRKVWEAEWAEQRRLRWLAKESVDRLVKSETERVLRAIQVGCIEALRDCKLAFSKEQPGQVASAAWLMSCIGPDGQLILCKWDKGFATTKDLEATDGTALIQCESLRRVSLWFCAYESARTKDDSSAQEQLWDRLQPEWLVKNENRPSFMEAVDFMLMQSALGLYSLKKQSFQVKPLLPMWLDLEPGKLWKDILTFKRSEVQLSNSKSRKPALRIGLDELASVRSDYKILIRAAIDGVVDASLPELVPSFKKRLFQRIDEVCAQATPRTAADSANLKVLAAKVARTDATIQALFAKLMADPEFGGYFEREVASIRAERELRALEAKLAAEAELKEREVKALELKLAEDAKLERNRVEAEIELRKEHLALESKKQSELLEQLKRQADAAEDAVTMARHQLQALGEQADATESAGRRVAKEIEKQERKNRGEWSILDDWFGG